MEYMAYTKSLREAAGFYQKNHPEFPDVAATYRKSADVIESLLHDIDTTGHVPHGRWIPVDDKYDAFDCSECDAMVRRRHNFCPKCGAKMDLTI